MARHVESTRVSLGLIEGPGNEWLILCPAGDSATERHWTFLHGPVRQGESPEAALRRMATDQLGVKVDIYVGQPPVITTMGGQRVELRCFFCSIVAGDPAPNEGFEIRWIPKAHLEEYQFDSVAAPIAAWLVRE